MVRQIGDPRRWRARPGGIHGGVRWPALLVPALAASGGCVDHTVDWIDVEQLAVAIEVGSDPGAGVIVRLYNDGDDRCAVVGGDAFASVDNQPLDLQSRGAYDEGIFFSEASSCDPPTFATSAPLAPAPSSVLAISGPDRQVAVEVANLMATRRFELATAGGVVYPGEVAELEWTVPTDRFDASFASLTASAGAWAASLDFVLAAGRLRFTVPADAPVGPVMLRLGLLRGPTAAIAACDGADRCVATLDTRSIEAVIDVAPR